MAAYVDAAHADVLLVWQSCHLASSLASSCLDLLMMPDAQAVMLPAGSQVFSL